MSAPLPLLPELGQLIGTQRWNLYLFDLHLDRPLQIQWPRSTNQSSRVFRSSSFSSKAIYKSQQKGESHTSENTGPRNLYKTSRPPFTPPVSLLSVMNRSTARVAKYCREVVKAHCPIHQSPHTSSPIAYKASIASTSYLPRRASSTTSKMTDPSEQTKEVSNR